MSENQDDSIKAIGESLGKFSQEKFGGDWEVHLFEKEKQEKRRKTLERTCPQSPDEGMGLIPKNSSWIVWLCDENMNITDLQVYELDKSNPYRWEKTVYYVQMRLEKVPFKNCGCICSDWDEWSLADLIFKLGCQYGFITRDVMIRSLKRLSQIDEFKKEIDNWLRNDLFG